MTDPLTIWMIRPDTSSNQTDLEAGANNPLRPERRI